MTNDTTTTAEKAIARALSGTDWEVYQDAAGEYRWRLTDPTGEIEAASGEGWPTRQECTEHLLWARSLASHDLNVATAELPDGDPERAQLLDAVDVQMRVDGTVPEE